MTVFLSYSRDDADEVELLREDIEALRSPVWFDRKLIGGQDWWNEILEEIRACELFVLAVSDRSLRSIACLAEMRYALDLRRAFLPVVVGDVDLRAAPVEVSRAQFVDYKHRTTDSVLALAQALGDAGAPSDLPDPLPDPPAIPESYSDPYRRRLASPSLDLDEQAELLAGLKIHANVDDDREEALALLRVLRGRGDIAMVVAQDIDAFLGPQPLPVAPRPSDPVHSGEKPAEPVPPSVSGGRGIGAWFTRRRIALIAAGLTAAILVAILLPILDDDNSTSVTVPGTQTWTDTGIDLRADDQVAVTATGSVYHNEDTSTGPDGDPEGLSEYSLIDDLNHAGLIGRITDAGDPFAIGSDADFDADEDGRLYLGINDTGVENNSGEFEASVTVTHP
jgi:TIR domain